MKRHEKLILAPAMACSVLDQVNSHTKSLADKEATILSMAQVFHAPLHFLVGKEATILSMAQVYHANHFCSAGKGVTIRSRAQVYHANHFFLAGKEAAILSNLSQVYHANRFLVDKAATTLTMALVYQCNHFFLVGKEVLVTILSMAQVELMCTVYRPGRSRPALYEPSQGPLAGGMVNDNQWGLPWAAVTVHTVNDNLLPP